MREIRYVYYDDGQLYQEVNLTNNLLNGSFIQYNKNGNMMFNFNFTKGFIDGEQIAYYPNGQIYFKMVYNMNKIISYNCYNVNGVQTTEGSYKLLSKL